MPSGISIGVLGPVVATRDGEPLGIGGPKPRAVLAALAASAGRVVSAGDLTDAVWGDEDVARPEHTLQVYVSSLRKALEPDRTANGAQVLVTQSPGYLLHVAAVDVDLARFDERRARGRDELARDPARAVETWRDALSAWRGPAFADLRGRPWFDTRGTRLDETRLATEEDLCDALLACGRHDEAIDHLESLTETHPFRERPRAQLMLALYRAGRQADALGLYRRTRDLLVEELGIEPGEELRRMEAAVLEQDPSLLAPSAKGDVAAVTVDTRQLGRHGALVFPDGQRFALGAGPTLLGRAAEATLQLADNRVSRRHALIHPDDTGVPVLTDLGSTNGTTVNGEPVGEPRLLVAGDELSLGGFALRYET